MKADLLNTAKDAPLELTGVVRSLAMMEA